MGFVKGLLGLAMTAGAAFAAVKVAKKYEENKEQDTEAAAAGEEPEEVPAGTVLGDLARAAGDVLSETGAKVRDAAVGAAEKAGVDTEGLKNALTGAGSAVVDAGSAVASYVAEEAPAAVERLKDGAQDVLTRVKETVAGVGTLDEDAFDDAVEDVAEAAQDAANAVEEAAEAVEEAAEEAPVEPLPDWSADPE